MGKFYYMTCRNKECRYRVQIREGEGMIGFARIMRLKEAILSGAEHVSPEIKQLLSDSFDLSGRGTYYCNECKEWKVISKPYIFESIHVSPYGTIRDYKVHYIYDAPVCDVCGSKVEFIPNPRSSKNKCPKCGMDDMRYGAGGYYD